MRGLTLSIALIASAAFAGESPYTDPWSPVTEQAAEAAVARLGASRALALLPSVLNIVGLEAVAVSGNVQGLREAMTALGAEETALEIRVNLPAEVLFDFDKSDIRADAAQSLAYLATLIRAHPQSRVRLEGHTDSVGKDAYNQALSERRAQSVARWLVEREHLDGSKFVAKGFGKSKPVASNDTEAGRQKNRRLEAVIEK
jgi:outer membrane protein OmpA-like peptidoglycan-associated protein